MKFTILGSGAGIPSRTRNTQSYILDVVEEINQYFLIDASEGLQHRILHTNYRPSKIKHVFITHLHGDHTFGLPGFLLSRANQGGAGIPLTIYGPKGLKEWIDITMKMSHSYVNYPIQYVELSHNETYEVEGFEITTRLLDHTVDSYLYVFQEPDKKGSLNSSKLKEIGIEPGPAYKEIKESSTFEFEGSTYCTEEFLSPGIPGRKISVHGDTRIITKDDYMSLVDGSDLIVHEATYLDGENEKAHKYFHSEIQNVLNNFSEITYGKILMSHVSNRYDDKFIGTLAESLPENVFVAHDFMEVTIPRIYG
ncbi:MBL fold metallo-hydrolase [Salinicoccus albus]|uniref:MBL fold metallo-hydrolase n=1 Tax=Salinicoccus albus TaxID=418756 RepID=UPI00036D4EBC|nr:MBL fold metallo-hydrolase [Salinicoccus albus]